MFYWRWSNAQSARYSSRPTPYVEQPTQAPADMDSFDKLFQHMPDYKIVVCKQCQFAIVPTQVKGHIQTQHPQINPQERRDIVVKVHALSNVARTAEDVVYPDRDHPPVKGLPVFRDGFQCQFPRGNSICMYICRKLDGMQKHCREKHRWENPRKPGRYPGRPTPSNKVRELPWVKDQLCQRFFKTGVWQRYFAVRDDQRREGSNNEVNLPSISKRAYALL